MGFLCDNLTPRFPLKWSQSVTGLLPHQMKMLNGSDSLSLRSTSERTTSLLDDFE